jgi:pimeloyl-ACP methyl ester carboxylesterase
MKRLALLVAVLALGAATPAGACAADDTCLHDGLTSTVTGQVWWDYNGDGVRQANEHVPYQQPAEIWADLNHDGERQEGEPLVESDRDGDYALPVNMRDSGFSADIRMRWSRYSYAVDDQYAPQCVAAAAGCKLTVTLKAGEEVPNVNFGSAGTVTILGNIWDDKNQNGRRDPGEGGARGAHVFLDDNRNGKLDPGEPTSYRVVNPEDGGYGMPIPTRYQAAGGDLPPLTVEQEPGIACTAPASCAITGIHTESGNGTYVRASHGIARPVVIFIHGYGGSQIKCDDGRLLWFKALWTGPDLKNMRLGGDDACPTHVDGLVNSVLGFDIYGSSSKHFEELAPGRHYDYVWDWRQTPAAALDGLDKLVDRARQENGVAQVQLVAHSMGGLVLREYIDRQDRADKVARAVSIATPYWGSVKSMFALAAGVQAPNFAPMDLFTDNEDMKAAAKTFPGHFALLPAFNYGPWLKVDGKQLDFDGIKAYMQSIGIDPAMWDQGLDEHGRMLDHYEDHGVDFQVIVGGGRPTAASVDLRYGIDDQVDTALVNWESGDETVVARAAAADVPRDRLHYVCDQKHVPLTVAYATLRLVDDFLIRAKPMHDEVTDCPFQAREMSAFPLDNLQARTSQAAGIRVNGRPLAEAEKAGLVQVLRFGANVKIVAGDDVKVEFPRGTAVAVRELSERGARPERRYVDGKPVKKDTTPPRTSARWRHGKLVLKAKGAAATYVVVKGKRRVYRRPITVKAGTRFFSVDAWGNTERARKVPKRR